MRHARSHVRNLLIAAAIAAPIILALTTVGVGQAKEKPASTDWPHWRGPTRNGISTETGWRTDWSNAKPAPLWQRTIGAGFSAVSVAKGRVYTMGNTNNKDTIWCLNADTGEQVWQKSYPCKAGKYKGPRATPVVDGKHVYTLSRRGHVFCLTADKGEKVWGKNIATELKLKVPGWGFAGSPLVVGDLVILNVGTAGVALNKKTGAVVWQTGPGAGGFSTPVLFDMDGKPCVLIFNPKALVCLDLKKGQEVWRHPWKTKYDVHAADPVVLGEKIFISSGYGSGCALLAAKNGKVTQVWRNREVASQFSTAVALGGYIYGIDGNTGRGQRSIKCLDLGDGSVKWSQNISGMASLMLADGKLIILIDGGSLSLVKATPDKYTPIDTANVIGGQCWTMPVLSGGRIYCRNNKKGQLVCLDVEAK